MLYLSRTPILTLTLATALSLGLGACNTANPLPRRRG